MIKLIHIFMLVLSSSCSGAEAQEGRINGNTPYFNATITQHGDLYNIQSHTNSSCIGNLTSRCRKGLIAYDRGPYIRGQVRYYSFKFKINQMDKAPGWIILFQDWTRIHDEDANGNRPITTIKLKEYGGNLYIQHWENSWQWEHDPSDFDTHLSSGRETMRGELKINKDFEYRVKIIIADDGIAMLFIDDAIISFAKYKNTHLVNNHAVTFGMYWSKGFNVEHDPSLAINIDISEISINQSNFINQNGN